MMEYIILVYLGHEDSKSFWGEIQGCDKLLNSNSFAEREKKMDVKIEAEVIKTLPFLICLEENAIAFEETNRKT